MTRKTTGLVQREMTPATIAETFVAKNPLHNETASGLLLVIGLVIGMVIIAGGKQLGDVEPVTVVMTEQAANELGLSIAGVRALSVPRQ